MPVEGYLPQALPEAARFTQTFADTDDMLYLFDGEGAQGSLLGYVSVSEGRGYGGPMLVVIGWSLSGEIRTVAVPKHREDGPWFRILENRKFFEQFVGKRDRDPLVLGKQIDAVSGATSSARGVAEGVLKARKLIAKKLGHKIPPEAPVPARFGLLEISLFFTLGLAVLLRFVPSSIKTRWRRAFVLLLGFVVIGVWAQQPLSLVNFATLCLGYVPPYQSSLFLYGLFGGVVLLAVFSGKNFYCFWLCPFSAVQEGAHLVTAANMRPGEVCGKALRNTKYIVLWFAMFVALLLHNPSMTVYEPWGALFTLRGGKEQWILVGLTLGAAMLVHNFWCYYLCPVGAVMEIITRVRHRAAALRRGKKC